MTECQIITDSNGWPTWYGFATFEVELFCSTTQYAGKILPSVKENRYK